MDLTGLHLLLTYQCTFECDHCFVWGSPQQNGTMTLQNIQHILDEGKTLETVNSIYFEGGEPFLYYATLVKGVRIAAEMGYSVGMVTNGYWATSVADARNWLEPFVGLIDDLTMSDDPYHWGSEEAKNGGMQKRPLLHSIFPWVRLLWHNLKAKMQLKLLDNFRLVSQL